MAGIGRDLLDLPFAAIRRYVGAGEVPPLHVDNLIAAAFFAATGYERDAPAN